MKWILYWWAHLVFVIWSDPVQSVAVEKESRAGQRYQDHHHAGHYVAFGATNLNKGNILWMTLITSSIMTWSKAATSESARYSTSSICPRSEQWQFLLEQTQDMLSLLMPMMPPSSGFSAVITRTPLPRTGIKSLTIIYIKLLFEEHPEN